MAKTKRSAAVTAAQKEIGDRLQWVLDEVMPNQHEAAEVLGVDPSTLNKHLRGTRAPSVFFVTGFAGHFRVSTDYVLRGVLAGSEDQELALKLAARHPELVIGRAAPLQDTDKLAAGKAARTKIPVPAL